MKNIRKIFYFFIFVNLQCFILKSQSKNHFERRLDVLKDPLGSLLEHNKDFVKDLETIDQDFEGIQENIVDRKKDIFKSMDTILSDFISKHSGIGNSHDEEAD